MSKVWLSGFKVLPQEDLGLWFYLQKSKSILVNTLKKGSEKHEEGVLLILTPEPNRISGGTSCLLCTILMQMTNASAHRVAVIRHAIDGLETVLRRNLPHSQLSPTSASPQCI